MIDKASKGMRTYVYKYSFQSYDTKKANTYAQP